MRWTIAKCSGDSDDILFRSLDRRDRRLLLLTASSAKSPRIVTLYGILKLDNFPD